MRISDWSSDVCSSDLLCRTRPGDCRLRRDQRGRGRRRFVVRPPQPAGPAPDRLNSGNNIGNEQILDLSDLILQRQFALFHALDLDQVEMRLLGKGGNRVVEIAMRSEERRVGKEGVRVCRSRWSPYH